MVFTNNKGFTLIELLVVVAIIGMLSSVVLSSLNQARANSRDARRTGDIHSIRTALELFYNAYNRYPSSADGNCVYNNSFASGGCLQVLVSNGFIQALPEDPVGTQTYYYDNWCREIGSNNQNFRVWANGETDNNGLAENWWYEETIGETTCYDPS
ncbi:MAG: type II secretion system protein [Patescibacteria group bacterium UBA2103]